MKVLVKNRLVDLAQLCVDLRGEGFTPYHVFQQLAEYAYHHGLAISTSELDWLVADAYR